MELKPFEGDSELVHMAQKKSARYAKKKKADSDDEEFKEDIPKSAKNVGKKNMILDSDDEDILSKKQEDDYDSEKISKPKPVKKGGKKNKKRKEIELEEEVTSESKKENEEESEEEIIRTNKETKAQYEDKEDEFEEGIVQLVKKVGKKSQKGNKQEETKETLQPIKKDNKKNKEEAHSELEKESSNMPELNKGTDHYLEIDEDVPQPAKKKTEKKKNKNSVEKVQNEVVTEKNDNLQQNGKGDTMEEDHSSSEDKSDKLIDGVAEITDELACTLISEDKTKEKKLTHKEKKKMKKDEEYKKMTEAMLKKGGQGHSELDSNFTVSQVQKTAGQMAALENAVDIKIENFSISAKGNDLFVNANLLIAQGRHYGLVGPNG